MTTPIADYTLQHGGGTFHCHDLFGDWEARPVTYARGYMVGLCSGTAARVNPALFDRLDSIARMVADEWEAEYIGTWWPEPEGDIYLDPVAWMLDLQDAMILARARNQETIWDWAAGAALSVAE